MPADVVEDERNGETLRNIRVITAKLNPAFLNSRRGAVIPGYADLEFPVREENIARAAIGALLCHYISAIIFYTYYKAAKTFRRGYANG
jgi:hypothetical protein